MHNDVLLPLRKQRWLRAFDWLIECGVHLLIAVVPLLFFPWGAEQLELIKQVMVLMSIGVLMLLWLASGWIRGERRVHGMFILGGMLFLLIQFLVVAFSQDRLQSLFGLPAQTSFSWLTLLGGVLLAHLIGERAATEHRGEQYVRTYVCACAAAAGFWIWSFARMQAQSFNTVGDVYALAMLLVTPLCVAIGLLIHAPSAYEKSKTTQAKREVIGWGLVLICASMLLCAAEVLANVQMAWMVLGGGVVGLLLLEVARHRQQARTLWSWICCGIALYACAQLMLIPLFLWAPLHAWLLLPIVLLSAPSWIVLGAVILIVARTAWEECSKKGSSWNWIGLLMLLPVYWFLRGGSNGMSVVLPPEIAPSFLASWDIAVATLKQFPLFGSGPTTWAFDYTQFHTSLLNQSPFWQTRFDQGFSTVLTLVPTIGLVGMLAWFGLIVGVGAAVRQKSRLLAVSERWPIFCATVVGWSVVLVSLCVAPSNMTQSMSFWLLLGILGSELWPTFGISLAHRSSRQRYAVVCALFACLLIGGGWMLVQRVEANASYRTAMQQYQAGDGLNQAMPFLQTAVALDPWNDAYARGVVQGETSLAMQAEQANVTSSSATVLEAFAAARDAAQTLVTNHPANADNWASAGLAFEAWEQVSPLTLTQPSAALHFYQQAHALDPWNPVFVTEMGKILMTRGERIAALPAKQPSDGSLVESSQADWQQALGLFAQAIQLKSDYIPARYESSVALERLHRLNEAIMQLEQVLRANAHDESVAFELALLYEENHQLPQAVNLLQQIVRVDPANTDARWYLASFDGMQGKWDDAVVQLQAIAQVLPQNQTIRQDLVDAQRARIAHRPVQSMNLPQPLPVEGPAPRS